MKIALGCDHAGYVLKSTVLEFLNSRQIEVIDFGAYAPDHDDDYPDAAFKVARSVADGETHAGILLCGTGFGISIAANKVRGIRAVACDTPGKARLAKAHNNINIIALGSTITKPEEVPAILDTWLNTAFEGGRHLRRINKISIIR